MARRKLARIKQFDIAKTRLAAVKSITPAPDFAGDISIPKFEAAINNFAQALAAYNTALSTVDDLYNQCSTGIANINDMNERILAGVAFKYGKESTEYEMAGGTRKKERKKRATKTAPAA